MSGARRAGCFAIAIVIASCGSEETPAPSPDPQAPGEVATPTSFEDLEGFWTLEQANVLLSRSEEITLDADLSGLSESEISVVRRLISVGEIAQRVYEQSRHEDALTVRQYLFTYPEDDAAEAQRIEALRSLYTLFAGPIAMNLESERQAFAPARPYEPGRNVYPTGTEQDSFTAYVTDHQADGLVDPRTIVRRRSRTQLEADRATLRAHSWLRTLHPELERRLSPPPDRHAYYAVPYALAYAEECLEMSRLLFGAADEIRASDPDLADYLEQRARDLLTDDYEAGDAAWINGHFANLNAQIGAYETYDDHLMGQKAFFGVSILLRANEASEELEQAVSSLSDYEAALPGGPYDSVRATIPLGIFDVIADYGQARGTNTASILPNEEHIVRKYGRTIVIRHNVLTHPRLLEIARERFAATVHADHLPDLGERGNFDRTVWHEVGHYLGPKTTTDGRTVTEALADRHNHFEELKADLVSLWLTPRLAASGVFDQDRVRAIYAAGILRTLVTTEPLRSSPYQTMQLMQQNWFLSQGVLRFDEGVLHIDYTLYPAAVEAMLAAVLGIQRAGDLAAANAFVEQWARWDDAVQGVLGRALDAVGPRYHRMRYHALETLAQSPQRGAD